MPKSKVFIFLLPVIIAFFLYWRSLNNYFFQDDWFTLRISRADNLAQFAHLFIPRTDIIYYRPLGMQIPFFLLQTFFGINPVPFHILIFLTHALNIVLVFYLIRLLLKNNTLGIFSAFLYGVSGVHFIPFYWVSTYPFVLGPTLFFLAFIFYLRFLNSGRKTLLLLAVASFIIGLFMNEIIAIFPLILLIYHIIFQKKRFSRLLPFFLILMLYIVLRYLFFAPPVTGLYKLGIGFYVLSNLKTYLFWSFNWSEIITEQMVRPFIFNDLIMKDYWLYAYISVFTFISFMVILLALSRKLFFSDHRKEFLKYAFFGASWFIMALAPVLFFSQHKFPYYLPISLVGMIMFIVYLFSKLKSYLIPVVFLLLWTITSVITIDYGINVHWAPRRARISKELTARAKYIYDSRPQRPLTISIPYSPENKLALNDQDGLKVFLDNEKIVTQYIK